MSAREVSGLSSVNLRYWWPSTLVPATTVDDVDHVLELIAHHAGRYVREHTAADLTCHVG